MAVAVWPASLPQRFWKDQYQEGMGDGRARMPMEAGPAKLRLRTRMPRPLSGTMVLSTAQLTTLRGFVDGDLAGGTLPFTFPAQSESGTWLVRFAGELPSWGAIGIQWRVSLSLEIMP